MPALVLNHLGQGASVPSDPAAAASPFFLLFPGWLLIPVLLLTTAATIIASQAVLSGAFALVQQAIQLGAVPRLAVRQTSDESAGQVYVPQVNWLLAIVVLGLVFGFRSSDALANAYGIAVAGAILLLDVTFVSALRAHRVEVGFDPDEASFFIGRETPVPSMRPDLSPWREALSGFLTHDSATASDHFLIPAPRVVEMGTRIEL